MKKIFIILSFLLSFVVMEAQQTKLLTAEKHNEYGLIYSLPVTALQIEVVMVKEVKIAGLFSKYSKIFTSDSNVIMENSESWTIESVKVTPFGVPDEQNRYLMQLKPGALTSICVAEDGMLLAINKEVDLPETQKLTVNQIEGTPITGKEYLEFVNEDFIAAQSSYKQAQILAEEIQEIRDAKISLTRGTAETMPTDGRQLELMLNSLEKQEKALTNAFTGAMWKEKEVRTFTYIPEKEGKEVLFRINKAKGVMDQKNYTEDPIYIRIDNIEEATLPVDVKGEEKKVAKDAVMYCIPGTATVSLTYKNSPIFQEDFQFSQFGLKFGINPTVFTDKKEPSYAVFNPATGALEELSVVK